MTLLPRWKRWVVWLILLLSAECVLAREDDAKVFRFAEPPGPYPVGFRVVEQYDYARVFKRITDELGRPASGELARPLQTLIWYPAVRSPTPPMTVADYIDVWRTEVSFGHPQNLARSAEWRAAMSAALRTLLRSRRDALAAEGQFPLVVYAPSFSNMAWENADLCEYLASYGYVVIATPSMGATTRNMTLDPSGVDAQARDISFLVGYARSLPNTDMSHIAVLGFSWGGLSNLVAAARDNRISALISLDGSLRYYPGLVKHLGVDPSLMTIPLLFFAQRDFSLEDQDQYTTSADRDGPSVLNGWIHGELVSVHMLGLEHWQFSSMYQRNEDTWWGLANSLSKGATDYSRSDAWSGYAWVARYTRMFLDARLKHEEAAAEFLERRPSDNGVPSHVMTVDLREATGRPTSFDLFRLELGKQGFEHAQEIYAAFHARNSTFKIEEEALVEWAQDLADSEHWHEAIAILQLSLQLYSNTSDTYVSLGDAYLKINDFRSAMDAFETALQKDPSNGAAKRKVALLRELRQNDTHRPSSIIDQRGSQLRDAR